MKNFQLFIILLSILLCSCHRITREEQCMEMVKHEKRRLPRNVAAGLVLDSMKYNPKTQSITYYHTMSDSLYTDEMIEYGKSKLEQQLQNEIINSISLKKLKDEGISFNYIYLSDNDGSCRLKMEFKNEHL